jgi:hypothetical protein
MWTIAAEGGERAEKTKLDLKRLIWYNIMGKSVPYWRAKRAKNAGEKKPRRSGASRS